MLQLLLFGHPSHKLKPTTNIYDAVSKYLECKPFTNVAVATGPGLSRGPGSSAINLVYYIIYKIFFQSKKSVFC